MCGNMIRLFIYGGEQLVLFFSCFFLSIKRPAKTEDILTAQLVRPFKKQ